jgi:hypothetical protein
MIPAPAPAGVRLLDNAPSGQSLSSHPAISAGFSRPVNPNSVRIKLDGRDVAQDAYVSSTKFVFTAPNMPPGSHTVQVTGRAQDGALFDRSWTFETGGDQAENFLGKLEPPPASNVAGRFTITGQTLPNARIKVSVSESASALSGIFRVKEDTFEETTTAGPNGRFAVNVHLQPLPGGKANVFIQSIAPSGAATIKRYSLNT